MWVKEEKKKKDRFVGWACVVLGKRKEKETDGVGRAWEWRREKERKEGKKERKEGRKKERREGGKKMGLGWALEGGKSNKIK